MITPTAVAAAIKALNGAAHGINLAMELNRLLTSADRSNPELLTAQKGLMDQVLAMNDEFTTDIEAEIERRKAAQERATES